ncbi:peptide chain release factor 1-like, mitochondrial [Daphnia pulex]|uniref:peptide chain release factor 1-like, mitochondrial n=1 Tax=Daphnia pulex TaxID=6669 RepID=UPI001EDCC780|nr:peptide chain release factor 1-like, mitochondrial [Daphnia pulex]
MVTWGISSKIVRVLSALRRPCFAKSYANNVISIRCLNQTISHRSLNLNQVSFENIFDPRLRIFLLNIKKKFDESGFQNIESKSGIGVVNKQRIQSLAGLGEKLLQTENDLQELKALSADDDKNGDLAKMVSEEFSQLKEILVQIQNEVLELILQEDNHQTEGIIMEFSAGVGGQESMLFCNEILQMYITYCESEGWDYELTDIEKSDLEGIRHAAICINNSDAYDRLQFESGVHRVQRVPKTEKAGRVHTSTVAVAILPRPSEVSVTIEQKDLKIETKRASGAGGQHVNTTESAVRIVHLPSGVVAECQTQRSQMQNRKVAMDKIRARLFQMKIDQQLATTRSSRKLQVGSSGRSEKIRTYNFPQDRITDHRINFTSHNLGEFLRGARPFHVLIGKLKEESYKERVFEFLEKIKV